MKRGLISSYIAGIRDFTHGEGYGTILRYFFPEFITAMLLYLMPFLIDEYFIGHLKSTSTYATLGATSTLLHLLIKISEALPVGTVILSGQFNGRIEYKEVGRTVRDSFWLTCLVGLVIASFLYFGAWHIYSWYEVPAEMIKLGVPFLRLRAISVFFMVVCMALIGFLRGIKNTRVPMYIFIIGALIFIGCDYIFIFGKLGFSPMGLQGSAWASIIQYFVMLVLALAYVLFDKSNQKYGIELFSVFKSPWYIKELMFLGWPVLLDKAIIASAYIWLCKMIGPMGTSAVASYNVINHMERFAITPATAFATVITILVSNDYGVKNWQAIKSNLKKVIFLTSLMVLAILMFFSSYPTHIIGLFDRTGDFTDFAARAFPILSVLAYFDLLQLLLSGALRGAANVKTVMLTRMVVYLGYFVPVSYLLAHSPIQDQLVKFILIYGSFYVGSALMTIVYINRFRSENWKI